MKVSVKTLSGSSFQIEVNPADKVSPVSLPICPSVVARVGVSGRDLGGGLAVELLVGIGYWVRFLSRWVGGVRGGTGELRVA
jgi:hypothetical protein